MDRRVGEGVCRKHHIITQHFNILEHGPQEGSKGKNRQVARDLHNQTGKCSPRGGGHEHFRNKLNQHTSQVSEIFHIHITEAAYCPVHQLKQFEAGVKIKK